MEDQNQSVLRDMEETRSALTDKLEALESKVAETMQPVTAAVERATEAAADLVVEVKDTVHDVKEKVGETVQTVSSAFDFRRHAQEHPWVVFSVAATAGCVLGSLLGRSSRAGPPPAPPRPRHAKGAGNGWAHRAAAEPARQAAGSEPPAQGGLAEEMQRLKALALGAIMGSIRDLVQRTVPGTLGDRIAEEVDNLTAYLGAETIRGPVLGEEQERGPERGSGGLSAETSGEAVNRLRPRPSGMN